jgi:hypothetical protein
MLVDDDLLALGEGVMRLSMCPMLLAHLLLATGDHQTGMQLDAGKHRLDHLRVEESSTGMRLVGDVAEVGSGMRRVNPDKVTNALEERDQIAGVNALEEDIQQISTWF